MRAAVVVLSLLLGLVGPAAAAVPAAPGAAAPFGVVSGSSLNFTWGAVAGATWYQLWIDDAEASPRLARWYTATAAGCGGGGTCTVSLTAGLATGQVKWWVRGWNAEGNGPWSAGQTFTLNFQPPAWATSLSRAERFQVILAGRWVLDRETGLVWQRQPATSISSWLSASSNCIDFTSGLGRLPTIQELRSVFAAFVGSNSDAPFTGILDGAFWSASEYRPNPTYAYYATIRGHILTPKTTSTRFWCVRGPGAAPP